MATIPLQKVYAVSTVSGNPPETKNYPEAASQTFYQGEPVYLSSGYVTACGADPSTILGFAAADGSNTTAGAVETPVWIANEDTYFCANVYHTSAPSAITAITEVGTSYGIVEVSNKWHIDLSDTSNTRVQVKWLDERDTVGDTYGRVWFKVLLANRQLL